MPLCSPDAGQELRYDFDPFRVMRCVECRLDFLSPRIEEEDILAFYEGQDYYAHLNLR